ncbi:DsbA family protein [Paralimibaculum aggregatum]|uniref:DsbA family protein n=2 Tax=Paralimibaculum aggregatum TaxID=3036245 RepID=A0ABQ6LJ14_9RHOB|nr:DsbA family protein [Limibaculum sp. NKW23]
MSPDRRRLLAGLAATPAALALLPAPLRAEDAAATPLLTGDVALGAEDAPVTVIEYASLTCPHCASFHTRTWPEVKAQYVDTGKVRFIMREVYFDAPGLWASMIARCGGETGYYPMIDAFLKRQGDWSRADDIPAALQKIGRLNGLSSERMRVCLTDRDFAETLVQNYKDNSELHEIRSTPSFVVNGELHSGAMGFAEFSALLDRALEG